jgi:hypothetical protein
LCKFTENGIGNERRSKGNKPSWLHKLRCRGAFVSKRIHIVVTWFSVYYDITSHPLWKRLHSIHNLARYDGNVYFLDKTDEVTEWSTGLDFRCYTSSKFEYFLLFFVKFSCSGYGTAVMKIIEITSMTMVQGNYHLKVCLALTFNSGEITIFYQNYEIKLGSFIRINLFKLDRWIA